MMSQLTPKQLLWIAASAGTSYGLLARLAFGLGKAEEVFSVMSSAFILGVPVVLGFLTVWLGEYRKRWTWPRRIFIPWFPAIVYLGCCLALAWEGIICIVLWLPLVLILSSVGGLFAGLLQLLFPSDRTRNYCAAVMALIPFAAAPLEQLRRASSEIRVVNTSIAIQADAPTVWKEIVSVPRIREEEHRFDWSHLLGFPRPIEAVLHGQGVGSIRFASFEGSVLFTEQVTEWEPEKRLSFQVHADPEKIPPTTFDEHVTIGGQYFDVLQGTYVIEKAGPKSVVLHLGSKQRLSTRFNFYSHLWTEALMADLQRYILRIIKGRCEHRA